MMRCFNVLQPNITRSENGKIFLCVFFVSDILMFILDRQEEEVTRSESKKSYSTYCCK